MRAKVQEPMTGVKASVLEKTTLLVTCSCGWEREARQELRRLLPGAQVESLHIGGNIIAVCESPVDEALATLRDAETYTLAHITPVQVRAQISGDRTSLDTLRGATRLLHAADPALSFRVACERRGNHDFGSREVERAVAGVVIHDGRPPVDLDHPRQVLSVEIFQNVAFLGMNRPGELLVKPLQRMRRWAPAERPISRAELKLREALAEFGIEPPATGRGLDLGAAPGGWTRVLAERMAQVVAVDPGELDERVLALPNVVHVRARVEELPADVLGHFDLVTNDMNLAPAVSAELMVRVAPLLAPGGVAIMTVKLPTRRRDRHVRQAAEVLSAAFEDIRAAPMPHNARERTMVMRRRGCGDGQGSRMGPAPAPTA